MTDETNFTCTCADCGRLRAMVNTQKRYNPSGYFERVCSDDRECEPTMAALFERHEYQPRVWR